MRLEDVDDKGVAKISVYSDSSHVVDSMRLKKGETSPVFSLPGTGFRAGMKIKLNDVVTEADKALLNIDGVIMIIS